MANLPSLTKTEFYAEDRNTKHLQAKGFRKNKSFCAATIFKPEKAYNKEYGYVSATLL